MSVTFDRDKDGGTPPAGTSPDGLDEDLARAVEAPEEEKRHDPEKSYGGFEHDFVGPGGDPDRMDHGRSTGRTRGGGE